MPCRTEEPSQAEIRASYEREFTHNSHVAEMLCAVLRTAEQNGIEDKQLIEHVLYYMDDKDRVKVEAWWTEHKARDRKRLQQEREEAERKRATQAALDKLTPKERELLGVRAGPRC